MAQTGTNAAQPIRRSLRWLLIGSLALNLLVLGVAAGALIRGPGGFGGSHRVDLQLGRIVAALAPEDRQAIRTYLRDHAELRDHQPRRNRDAMLRDMLAVLRADSFAPEMLQDVLRVQRDRGMAVQSAAQDALIARIALMSPQQRSAFADRLEAEIGGRQDAGGDGD